MVHSNYSLQDIEIITALSDSKKSEVYLVSLKSEEDKFAVLKKHRGTGLLDCYQKIADLKSEYFPEIYAVWEEQGDVVLLEEYISGRTLQEKLDGEVLLQEKEVTFYAGELCRALQILHSAVPPIIHRDIKPENIIITEAGKVRLLDFDAAREYKEHQEKDTVLLGTKEYASPEQFGFMQTDVRSDIYSLGIVFAELLEHARVSGRYSKTARKIIDRATMFDPEKRYPDAGLLLRDLSQLGQAKAHLYLWVSVAAILVTLGIIGALAWEKPIPVAKDFDPDITLEPDLEIPEKSEETDATERVELGQETLPVEEKESVEEIELLDPIKAIEATEAVPLAEAYHYVSIEEEVQTKCYSLMENRSDLYYGFGFDDNDSGMYSSTQESVIGRDYVVLRFLKKYPRNIVIQDNRFEGKTIDTVSYCPYLEETGTNGSRQFLEADDYTMEYGNVVSVSAEYLQTLEPGAYTFTINTRKGTDGFLYGFYLIVHGEEEQVDNFKVHTLNEIAYYSSESRNDVVFYANNTPYPIQEVWGNNKILSMDSYQLVDDGFGVVLSADFLEQYEEQETLELLIKTANDKWFGGRVIYLKHF